MGTDSGHSALLNTLGGGVGAQLVPLGLLMQFFFLGWDRQHAHRHEILLSCPGRGVSDTSLDSGHSLGHYSGGGLHRCYRGSRDHSHLRRVQRDALARMHLCRTTY